MACFLLGSAVAFSAQAGVVSGTIRYQDKLYDTGGFTGVTEYKPVRRAEVEIIQSGIQLVLGRGVTNIFGGYRIAVASEGSKQIYVRCYARNTSEDVDAVVMNKVSQQAIYAVDSSSAAADTDGKIHFDMDITAASGAGGAFNIFDTAVGAALFMREHLVESFPVLTFYWQPGSTDGTYYDPWDDSIHLLGKSSDTDEYDDDIILHEIGHYVCGNFSRDNSPGGSHSLTGHYNVRLTWSEGWASFFSSAVRNEGWMIDTFFSTAGYWNVETPSYGSQARGADNEVAVAAVLWDLYDGADTPDGLAPGDDDRLSLGFEEIWHLMHGWMKVHGAAEMKVFWDGWLAGLVPVVSSEYEAESIFAGRRIYYTEDEFELNNALGQARKILTTGESHLGTLPSTLDADWFTFDVLGGQVYQATAREIRSGAYVNLALYDEGGGLVAQQTNPSIGATATAAWTPPSNGWMYAKLQTTGGTQAASYSLQVAGTLADGPMGGPGEDDYGDDIDDSYSIPADGTAAPGRIESAGDADVFDFELEKGWLYEVSVTGSGEDNFAELTLYDDDEVIFGSPEWPGGSQPTELSFFAARGGTYFARVYHYDRLSGTGDYTLSVTPLGEAEVAGPGLLNFTPEAGETLHESEPPLFRWGARDVGSYRAVFSRFEGDPLSVVFPFAPTSRQKLGLNAYQWALVRTLGELSGNQLYWSVSSGEATSSVPSVIFIVP